MTISGDTQKILELLTQVILADGHVYESEVKALIESSDFIGLTDMADNPLSNTFLTGWFSNHSEDLSAFKAADNSDVQLTRLILSLSDWPNKAAVVKALEKISQADGEVHLEEKLLISIVRAYWQHEGLDAPGSSIEPR